MIWTRSTALLLAFLFAPLGAGCFFILNWDRANLPCAGVNQECSLHYSCLDGKCVPDGIRQVDESCARDVQCADGSLCPNNLCARVCNLAEVYQTSSCSPGHYCAPFVSSAGYTGDPNDTPAPKVVSVCVVGSGCNSGDACPDVAGGICTVINGNGTGVNACVVGCDISVSTDGNSTNNCGQQYYPRYCTPLGEYNYQQLGCVSTGALGINAHTDGQACETAAQPCEPAYGCMAGSCRRYCTPASGATTTCQTNEQCCPYSLALTHLGAGQDPTGFCFDSSSSCPRPQ